MREAHMTPVPFTIHLTSQDSAPADSAWQEECRQFYHRLVEAVDEGELAPVKHEAPEGSKTDVLELFHQIVTYGISIGAFSALYQLTKLWLEQRSRCDIVLKFPDGSEMKVRGLSQPDAEQIMRDHQQTGEDSR
jgi:hypothetical protein